VTVTKIIFFSKLRVQLREVISQKNAWGIMDFTTIPLQTHNKSNYLMANVVSVASVCMALLPISIQKWT
jgi:hypothetical protein